MFVEGLQWMGTFRAVECPCPVGPRNSGQDPASTSPNAKHKKRASNILDVVTRSVSLLEVKLQLSSGDQIFQNVTVNIGEPAIDSIVPEDELLVVNAEQAKNGRVDIINFAVMVWISRLI